MSRGLRAWIPLAAAVAVLALAVVLATGGDEPPTTVADRAQSIAAELRCPVCQNLSVADSPSRLAGEMRAEIDGQLRAGRTDEEVRAYFVARYGEWVLLEPTRHGLNLLPWLLPIAGLLAGLVIWAAVVVRRPRERAREAA